MKIRNWWNPKRGKKIGLCALAAIPVSFVVAAQVVQPPAGVQSFPVADQGFDSSNPSAFPPGCSQFMIVNVRGTSIIPSSSPKDNLTEAFTQDFTSLALADHQSDPQDEYVPYDTPSGFTWAAAVLAIPATVIAVLVHDPFPASVVDREALAAYGELSSGVTDTSNYLLPLLGKCRSSIFILDGYSFGAWVVKDVYNALPAAERGRVLLVAFGDPTFDPSHSWDDAGNYFSVFSGVAGPKPFTGPYAAAAGRNNPYSTYVGPQVRDYCMRYDLVCQKFGTVNVHLDYVNKGLVNTAAQWAFTRWQQGIPLGS